MAIHFHLGFGGAVFIIVLLVCQRLLVMWSQKVQVGVLAVAESAALVAVAEVSPAVVSAAAVAAAGKPHTETNSVDTFKLLTNNTRQ